MTYGTLSVAVASRSGSWMVVPMQYLFGQDSILPGLG